QLGDWRQYAESVRRKKDYVLGMAANSRNHRAINVIHRIRAASILRATVIVVVRYVRIGIERDVFQHGSKTDRIPYLRFVFLGELDALGVAAAFKVKDAGPAPAVLIIADQKALWISRKRGLAGAGKPEEQSRHAVLADVG